MAPDYNSVYPYIWYDFLYKDVQGNKDSREDRAIKDSKNLQCKIDNLLSELECMVRERYISESAALHLKKVLKGDNNE